MLFLFGLVESGLVCLHAYVDVDSSSGEIRLWHTPNELNESVNREKRETRGMWFEQK
jgi:hypothetical protein